MLFSILLLLFSSSSHALTVTFHDPCEPRKVLGVKKWLKPYEQKSLGSITLESLDELKLDYIGAEKGIHTIQGTPVGEDALEIISREEMRAYGWCFHLDGKLLESYPDEVFLDKENKKIDWFFGFAHYIRGKWVSQCEPTSKTRTPFVCSKK
ncbi:MAG: hypothetical protein M9962_12330 [Oligoflexia bacterium]|nr:hypothetical protein [Oligoflexia bacterium]